MSDVLRGIFIGPFCHGVKPEKDAAVFPGFLGCLTHVPLGPIRHPTEATMHKQKCPKQPLSKAHLWGAVYSLDLSMRRAREMLCTSRDILALRPWQFSQ